MQSSWIFKVIVAGAGGVGKTAMITRYCTGKFEEGYKMTIGAGFHTKSEILDSGEAVKMQLWDFAGQYDFRQILRNYATGANGALLLFDLTNKSSLGNIDEWVDIFRKQDPNLPIVFLGTKLDLTDLIVIEDKDALFYKEKYGFLGYLKVSSKTDVNVNLAFEQLVNEIIENQ